MQPYIPRKLGLSLCFSVYFLFCIAKGLAICKFGGVISAECCTVKPLNSHMLIHQCCYLFDFALFLCFRSNARVPLEIGLKGTSWHHSVAVNDHPKPVNDRIVNDRPKPCDQSHSGVQNTEITFLTAELDFSLLIGLGD
jgi:hypothetical protein